MTGRVVVGGEALVDLVPTGDEHPDDPALRALAPRLGGGPFNVAVGLGRLGVPTTMRTAKTLRVPLLLANLGIAPSTRTRYASSGWQTSGTCAGAHSGFNMIILHS